ncbi:unnamed protein product [Effrenium voratum]|nr:unnamed protein product [Effrenium voratum]
MCTWMEGYAFGEVYDWVELYAGRALATQAVRLKGQRGARLDILYAEKGNHKSNYMDINSPSGLALCIITILQCKRPLLLKPLPRNYPWRFAAAIAGMVDELKNTCQGLGFGGGFSSSVN